MSSYYSYNSNSNNNYRSRYSTSKNHSYNDNGHSYDLSHSHNRYQKSTLTNNYVDNNENINTNNNSHHYNDINNEMDNNFTRSSSHPNSNSFRICKYYSTNQGCLNGARCLYQHIRNTNEQLTRSQSDNRYDTNFDNDYNHNGHNNANDDENDGHGHNNTNENDFDSSNSNNHYSLSEHNNNNQHNVSRDEHDINNNKHNNTLNGNTSVNVNVKINDKDSNNKEIYSKPNTVKYFRNKPNNNSNNHHFLNMHQFHNTNHTNNNNPRHYNKYNLSSYNHKHDDNNNYYYDNNSDSEDLIDADTYNNKNSVNYVPSRISNNHLNHNYNHNYRNTNHKYNYNHHASWFTRQIDDEMNGNDDDDYNDYNDYPVNDNNNENFCNNTNDSNITMYSWQLDHLLNEEQSHKKWLSIEETRGLRIKLFLQFFSSSYYTDEVLDIAFEQINEILNKLNNDDCNILVGKNNYHTNTNTNVNTNMNASINSNVNSIPFPQTIYNLYRKNIHYKYSPIIHCIKQTINYSTKDHSKLEIWYKIILLLLNKGADFFRCIYCHKTFDIYNMYHRCHNQNQHYCPLKMLMSQFSQFSCHDNHNSETLCLETLCRVLSYVLSSKHIVLPLTRIEIRTRTQRHNYQHLTSSKTNILKFHVILPKLPSLVVLKHLLSINECLPFQFITFNKEKESYIELSKEQIEYFDKYLGGIAKIIPIQWSMILLNLLNDIIFEKTFPVLYEIMPQFNETVIQLILDYICHNTYEQYFPQGFVQDLKNVQLCIDQLSNNNNINNNKNNNNDFNEYYSSVIQPYLHYFNNHNKYVQLRKLSQNNAKDNNNNHHNCYNNLNTQPNVTHNDGDNNNNNDHDYHFLLTSPSTSPGSYHISSLNINHHNIKDNNNLENHVMSEQAYIDYFIDNNDVLNDKLSVFSLTDDISSQFFISNTNIK